MIWQAIMLSVAARINGSRITGAGAATYHDSLDDVARVAPAVRSCRPPNRDIVTKYSIGQPTVTSPLNMITRAVRNHELIRFWELCYEPVLHADHNRTPLHPLALPLALRCEHAPCHEWPALNLRAVLAEAGAEKCWKKPLNIQICSSCERLLMLGHAWLQIATASP